MTYNVTAQIVTGKTKTTTKQKDMEHGNSRGQLWSDVTEIHDFGIFFTWYETLERFLCAKY